MKKTLLSLVILASLTACNSANETENKNVDEGKQTAQDNNETAQDKSDHQSEDKIQLNNGEKWTINEEMKPHINKGAEILNDYLSGDNTDYLALAEQLKKQNTALIKSCTMKGEAHDELHNWLHPHINLIDQLKKAENKEKASEVISQLEESFQKLKKYFQ